jgi:hypothetical protein
VPLIVQYSLYALPLLFIIGVLFFPVRFSFGVSWGEEVKVNVWLWNISLKSYKNLLKNLCGLFLGLLNLIEKVVKQILKCFRYLGRLKPKMSLKRARPKAVSGDLNTEEREGSKQKLLDKSEERELSDAELMREVLDDISLSVEKSKESSTAKLSAQELVVEARLEPKSKPELEAKPKQLKPKASKKKGQSPWLARYTYLKSKIEIALAYLNKGQVLYQSEKDVLLKTLAWGVQVLWKLKGLLSLRFRRIELKLGTEDPYQSSKILVYKPFVDLISPFKENHIEVDWVKAVFEGKVLVEVDHKIYKSFLYGFRVTWGFPWRTIGLRAWKWARPWVVNKLPFVNA